MTRDLLTWPLWLALLLPLAKIVATSLSIGSGGSGGIFGPGMVIGGTIGAAGWLVGQAAHMPSMPAEPAPFVIIGMMATFGGIAHAPLAMMLMVAEMTGNLSLLAPAMVAVAISTALVGDQTIYRSQLPDRASAPAHRVRFSFPLLGALLVRDAQTAPGLVARLDTPVSEVAGPLLDGHAGGLLLRDAQDRYAGCVLPEAVRRLPPERWAATPVGQLLQAATPTLRPDQTLEEALDQVAASGLSWAPVVEGHRLVGRLSVRDVAQTYKATLERSVRRVRGLPPEATLFEIRLAARSPLVGQTLRAAALPSRTLVVAINREGEMLFPRADTRLTAGDVVTLLADPASEPALRALLDQPPAASSAD